VISFPPEGGTVSASDFTISGRHSSSGFTPSAAITVNGNPTPDTPFSTTDSPGWSLRYKNFSTTGSAQVVVTVDGQDSVPRNFTII
jgi:hypothetical protein